MTAERWQQVKAIFDRAVAADPTGRAEFVREWCGNDEELHREVQLLLAADREAGSLLETPPFAGPAPQPPEPIQRRIGNYLINGEPLARGGMGIVYRARHMTLPRETVVKCIRTLAYPEEVQNDLRVRFRREAHVQSQLDHPHIVRVYEFLIEGDEYFLVMEYVPGSSLRRILNERGSLPPHEAIDLAAQALEGLAYAHSFEYVDESGKTGTGVIHRDIKPANLLVDAHGRLKLTDFGIVKLRGGSEVTRTGFNIGTVEYMSPEQVRGSPLDARSDLYSLGVTLYEALTGRVPFQRKGTDSDFDVLRAHVDKEPPPIRGLNPAISPAVAEAVNRSLRKDPDRRWQNAAEFREALLSCQPGAVNVSIAARHDRKTNWILARWKAGAAALILLLAIVAGGGVWFERHRLEVREKTSIAVLPFVDMSPAKDQEYFSDGLSEELMEDLAYIPGLRVVGSTSSFQFKGKNEDLPSIGRKLHVKAILEGTVRKHGNRVKITVHLINARDGFRLWSQDFDMELTDIFAVQEQIARAVMSELKVTLVGERPAVAKTANGEAYNAFLWGHYFLDHPMDDDNLVKAIGYFEKAIKLDPKYALAWVELGESRQTQASLGLIPVEEGYRNARQAAEKAMTLDPHLVDTYILMAEIQMYYDRDWNGAVASIHQALNSQPDNISAMTDAGLVARCLGRLDEAIGLFRRIIEVDPLQPGAYRNLGIVLLYSGRPTDAAGVLKKGLDFAPKSRFMHAILSRVYLAQSRPSDALEEALKETHEAYRLCTLALVYGALGRKTESDASLAELIAKHPEAPYMVAETYAIRGETDRAFEWLQRAYTERDGGITDLKVDPAMKSLRSDTRYSALLTKVRLPPN